MAFLSEQELVCTICNKKREMPVCCCKEMEYDQVVLFCEVCNKEIKPYKCCNQEMVIRKKVRDIKKELFKVTLG